MKMKLKNYLIVLNLIGLSLNAATFSGVVENKFGDFIGYTELTATNVDTSEVVAFTAERDGLFSVELSNGSWIIETDISQTEEWGYAALSDYELVVDSDDITQNIILNAREPLDEPEIEIYKNQFGALSLLLLGQGGTRFIVERSYNLEDWHSYHESTTAKGGLTISANAPSHQRRVFYRLTATTE